MFADGKSQNNDTNLLATLLLIAKDTSSPLKNLSPRSPFKNLSSSPFSPSPQAPMTLPPPSPASPCN